MRHTPETVEALRVEMHRLDKKDPRSRSAHAAWKRWARAYHEVFCTNGAEGRKGGKA